MSFKKIVTSKRFWPSVLFFAILFIIFFNLIRVGVEYKFHFGSYFSFHFQDDHLINFIVSNVVGGIIYGFAVVYFRYRRFHKEKRPRR